MAEGTILKMFISVRKSKKNECIKLKMDDTLGAKVLI